MVAVEDFLTLANPELVECFEEAERTFNLDESCAGFSSHAAEGESDSSEESDSDCEAMPMRTEDVTEDGIVEVFFSETCEC